MTKDAGSAGSDAAPPGGWEQLIRMITETNSGVTAMQTEQKKTNDGLEKVSTELASFKSDVAAKITELEKKHESLAEHVESRMSDFKDEVLSQVSEEVAVKLREWKEGIKDEILAEIHADNSPGAVPMLGKTNVSAKFDRLLKLSGALENNFCMGHVRHQTPTIRAASVIKQFFPDSGISLGSVQRDAKLVRFCVPPKFAVDFRAKLQEVRGAISGYGWWISQENPADLRAMYTVTNNFLKFAKNDKPALKPFFLTVERGWVFFHDAPIVPVFLIPSDTSKWADLAKLLLPKLQRADRVDWFVRATVTPTHDKFFLGKWIEVMGLEQELADSLLPLISDSQDSNLAAGGEAMDVSNVTAGLKIVKG